MYGRNINQLLPVHVPTGDRAHTQACPLPRKQTSDLSFCRVGDAQPIEPHWSRLLLFLVRKVLRLIISLPTSVSNILSLLIH